MSAAERIAEWGPTRFLELIASRAEAFAEQAGVGGMEIAGLLVSYLAEHPDDIEPFITGGIFELPMDWIERGRLTWHATNGTIVHPEQVRAARARKGAQSS